MAFLDILVSKHQCRLAYNSVYRKHIDTDEAYMKIVTTSWYKQELLSKDLVNGIRVHSIPEHLCSKLKRFCEVFSEDGLLNVSLTL